MALEEYRRKRDFEKTAEPAPGKIKARIKLLSYLIQKHDATRLHYDFRLELDGVLLSWAVTKGPSYNPSDKRLAVRTEDHPLSYGTFEGTIPKGQYGGGTVMLWDQGTWKPKGDPHAGLEKGHLSFELHGERLKGGWDLIRMRGNEKRENWLLIKENDEEAKHNGANGDLLDKFSTSVKTGRSMNQIAEGESAPHKKVRSTTSADGLDRLSISTTNSTAAPKTNADGLVAGGIAITHPDRIISEVGHITKGDLAEYHAAVAPFMLPGIVKRPLSLLRCPSGIAGDCFYQRNPGKGLGPDVHPFKFKHKGKRYEYLYIEDEEGLLTLIQMGVIEIHPWGAPIEAIDYPDRMIFDLDPAPDVPFDALKLAAQDLRQRLKRKGLESDLKCTGGKGLHVTIALAGKDKWPEVKSFAASVVKEMVETAPEAYVATMTKAKRKGKIFIDYFRNDYTATAIGDYSVRARPGMPVAVPLEWNELRSLKSPSQFTMKDVLKRLKNTKPDKHTRGRAQKIPHP
jgi:bifunctional non-homologous end joining protein LigD